MRRLAKYRARDGLAFLGRTRHLGSRAHRSGDWGLASVGGGKHVELCPCSQAEGRMCEGRAILREKGPGGDKNQKAWGVASVGKVWEIALHHRPQDIAI